MTVRERILKTVGEDFGTDRIKRVCVGMLYTSVQLEGGSAGVSYSFPRRGCGPSMTDGGMGITGRSTADIVRFLATENLADSAIALSTINALAAAEGIPRGARKGDALDAIDIADGDRVCMVGCFFPLMERLRARAVEVRAVDLEPKPGVLPAGEAFRLLAESDIALITATSLINGTIDDLLDAAGNCREVLLLGPSTPLLPPAFEGTPVTCLAGIQIERPQEVFRAVEEGGGFREFKPYTRKFTVRIGVP